MDENENLNEIDHIDIPNDEDNDEDNDDDEMIPDDDSANNNADEAIIDGGVAEDSTGQSRSSESAVVLYIECQEDFSSSILAGTTISIGLEKTTKLSAVFERFCTFLNTYKCKADEGNHDPCDFEFLHCSVLCPSDTVETAALMKEDRIKVLRNQGEERRQNAQFSRERRDSDQNYFEQLQTLLPDRNPSVLKTDVVFHCKGKIKDEQGLKQSVLSTSVRGHSAILIKRCKWLARKIEESKQTNTDIVPSQKSTLNHNIVALDENSNHAVHIHDGGVPFVWQDSNNNAIGSNNDHNPQNIANEVEQDEDEESHHLSCRSSIDNEIRALSPVISFVGTNNNPKYQVTLEHPPEVVKLLLEYCYTNRVVSLGYLAFKTSFRPVDPNLISRDMKNSTGPVGPRYWKHEGRPDISFNLALAGIRLAEEANLPRFSLMCEIAASQLVTRSTGLEALALCEEQRRKNGNHLNRLRKAVMMYHILGNGSKGVTELSSTPSFKRTLKEKKEIVVPSLLMGVSESLNERDILPTNCTDSKYENLSGAHFSKIDDDDKIKRESERRNRRKERWNKRPRERNPYHLEHMHKEMTQIILNDDIEFDSTFGDNIRSADLSGNGRRIPLYGGEVYYKNLFDFSHSSNGRAGSGSRRTRNSIRASSRRKRRK